MKIRRNSSGRERAKPTQNNGTTSVPTVASKDSLKDQFRFLDEKLPGCDVFDYQDIPWSDQSMRHLGPRAVEPVFTPRIDDCTDELDLTLPVRSRAGYPGAITECDLAVDNAFPIKAVIFDKNFVESTWTIKGKYIQNSQPHPNDLFNCTREEYTHVLEKHNLLTNPVEHAP